MVRIEQEGTSICAYIYGEIDHHTARTIREAIDSQVELRLPKTLILDFADVSFMDSSGIGLVMGRFKLMTSIGGEVKISNTTASIGRVMRLAGLERLAKIEE
ncbi:MAG: anti-sigma factor antagonist [Oscillospiraceae bacterium]